MQTSARRGCDPHGFLHGSRPYNTAMAKKKNACNYADAIAEIERILAKFRTEQPDVDTLTAEVKRATELIAACKAQLKRVEGEVTQILDAE